MNLGLEGRVALVTGAGRGLGAAIARRLADEGCDVALVDLVREGPVHEVAEEIRGLGRRALTLACDVRDVGGAEAAVAEAVRELGALHVLVCNAGITRDAVVWKMSEDDWDEVVDVNLKGCFSFVRAAVPFLREAGWGRVVAVSSINGLRGKFGQANYTAAKAGLVGLSMTLARELGAFGVTVNVVAPGMVLTEMARALPDDVVDRARAETVLGRLTEPDDVADAVTFLCSEAARSITGQVLRVDAGQDI
jgi:3-oxoacyl-[acyl-carrier protein] reductase